LLNAIEAGDMQKGNEIAKRFLLNKEQSTLAITDKDGQIVVRAEDEEKIGGSLSDDRLVKEALAGSSRYGLVREEGVLAPEISIRAAAPIQRNGEVVAVVLSGYVLDSAFFDGVKHKTGLDVALMGGDVLSASSITAGDGSSRWVGTIDVNADLNQVAMNGEAIASDRAQILNEQYLAAYRPLKGTEEETIGILFVGVPFTQVVDSARKAVQLTMASTVILLVILLVPTRWLAYKIGRQVR
jgi:sensor histidine kinase regulating citrate/malate metabolism